MELKGCRAGTKYNWNDKELRRMCSWCRCSRDGQVCVTKGAEKCFHLLFKILTLPPSRPFIFRKGIFVLFPFASEGRLENTKTKNQTKPSEYLKLPPAGVVTFLRLAACHDLTFPDIR